MKIIIVDDHVLFREGLAAIIQSEPDIKISGLAGTVREAVDLSRSVQPDIILMDFHLPDGTGVDATRAILREQPNCRIIFLTISEEDDSLFAAVRSGAKGYLLKNIHPTQLVSSLRAVYSGESALSRSMTLKVMEELARGKESEQPKDELLSRLTQRELDVLRALAAGLSNQEIGVQLCLSENTVKHHMHFILEKLNLSSRREAANFARQHGLV